MRQILVVVFFIFRSENSSLRALLNRQHEDGQHAALEQLSALKEQEKEEIRINSEKNLAILQSKVRLARGCNVGMAVLLSLPSATNHFPLSIIELFTLLTQA